MHGSKLAYKPIGMLAGGLGGMLAGLVFKRVWKLIDGRRDAPSATDENRTWREVLAAAALQGAIFALVRAAVDRGGAKAVHRMSGARVG
jgi:predicted metal-dependent enzyme (double-stranded beta helix superfamily)